MHRASTLYTLSLSLKYMLSSIRYVLIVGCGLEKGKLKFATWYAMELVIFIGLQGSGKSTFFRTHFAATHEYMSKDLLRNNKHKSRRQAQLIEQALAAGHSVVVDNTNPTVEDREPLIHLGRAYNATIVGYYFESHVKESLERNEQRSGWARVPKVAIYVTAKKLVKPSYAEGFDKLYYVRITDNSTFEMREWGEQSESPGHP
jgi:predicted kinase